MTRWWVTDLYHTDPVFLFSWVVWVVASIVLHELSHGWTAIRHGDDTPRLLGHMTLNPFVHIPPMGWVVFALFGMVWGMMPVDHSRLRGRHADAVVAFAGPAMNLTLAVAIALAASIWEVAAERVWGADARMEHPFHQNLSTFLHVGVFMNLAGAGFNLIPVPPLDGSRILASFWRGYARVIEGDHALYIMIFGLAIGGTLFWPIIFPIADALSGEIIGGFTRAIR